MAKKITIYTVQAPFQWDKNTRYEPGDDFTLPPGWYVDEAASEFAGKLTFAHEEPLKSLRETSDSLIHRVSLPVQEKV